MDESILEKIYGASLKFLEPLTPLEAYKIIVHEAIKLVKADYGSIFLVEQEELKRVYASNNKLFNNTPRKKGWVQRVFKKRKTLLIDVKQIHTIHPGLVKLGVKSILLIPLSYKGESLGVLTVQSAKKEPFLRKDLETLKLFGSMATMAIRKIQLYAETKKALETRDLFISMASHELRTPLTVINGYVQLLVARLKDRDSVESKWSKELSWETLRLTQLIKELLEVDRIKSGELDYVWKECDLKDILNRAISIFEFSHPEHKIILNYLAQSEGAKVIGDYDKLLQAISNILDNSAKFSPSNRPIYVYLKGKARNVILKIEDRGFGVSKEEAQNIFDSYYIGKNHRIEGMGLGLYLVKNIIKQHHGILSFKSKEGRGTSVAIKLPLAK